MNLDYILQVLQTVVIIAVLCEGLTESIKLIFPKPLAENQKQAISFVIGIILCICCGLSLFTGPLVLRLIGAIFAGILAGRGSNYIHSLIDIFSGFNSILKFKKIKG